MFKNINAGLIASRASFLTDRNRLLYTRLIKNSTGEQVYSSSTGYVYHIFTEPGSFEVHTPGYVDIMLVGGGGGGGGATNNPDHPSPSPDPFNGAGGGGAGGVAHWYNKYIPAGSNVPCPYQPENYDHMPGTYTVNVGDGGGAGSGSDIIVDGDEPNTSPQRYDFWHRLGGYGGASWVGAPPSDSPVGSAAAQNWGMKVYISSPSVMTAAIGTKHLVSGGGGISDYVCERIIAAGGGGGGSGGSGGAHDFPVTVSPASDPNLIYAALGRDGGSQGGHGHVWIDEPGHLERVITAPSAFASPHESWLHPDESPQGNSGGFNDADVEGVSGIAGGGGGGAGEPGRYGQKTSDGSATWFSGAGGAGVAAFNGDTGIPIDYGTPGPGNDPTAFYAPFPALFPANYSDNYRMVETRTRWFGGGGHGGFNDNWQFTDSYAGNNILYAAINGYIGGGGARFGPPSLSGSNNPLEFAEGSWPIAHYQNGKANTGGGGCGGAARFTSLFPAGSGGSGIVIIRYQAAH